MLYGRDDTEICNDNKLHGPVVVDEVADERSTVCSIRNVLLYMIGGPSNFFSRWKT